MADNIYLLETRLSKAQQAALASFREVARARGLMVFLVGGAVRDLIGGTAVRDLDVAVQGSALKIKKDIERAGGVVTGENEAGQSIFARFPGGVRMEIGSTLSVSYPKPGKAVAKPATILEDLRRRDFTANAMALSLNEGSYGLLMDPLNGVADIENRELRLVSNYGFIEDPVRMIRAARFMARLGWGMDEKTQGRYETGKSEGYISALDDFHRGYETEEIFYEEDPLRVMRRLEEEGWMQYLAPALSAAKANVAELERLRESQAQLQTNAVIADGAAANFPLLTAKMAPGEVQALKKSFVRQGFVRDIEALEAKGKEFAGQLGAKNAALPSQAYKLITAAEPEAVLWAAHTTKSGALQAKFKSFYSDWQQARQRIPYVQMQEMRITPEVAGYEKLVEKLFFELMDGKLQTPEEVKEYLEPYSPPAPPPPVSLRRPRAPKKDAKPGKSRKKVAEPVEGDAVAPGEAAESAPVSEEIPAVDAADAAPADSSVAASREKAAPKVESAEPASPAKAVAHETPAPKPAKTTPAKPVANGGSKGAKEPKGTKDQKGKATASSKQAEKPAPKKVTAKVASPAKGQKAAKKHVSVKKAVVPSKTAKKATPPAKGSKLPAKGAASKPGGAGVKTAAKKAPAKGPVKKIAAKGSGAASKKAPAKRR